MRRPWAFIDHSNYRIRLADAQDSQVWKQHATWIKTPGLADKDGVSFQAATHTTRYLRIRPNGEAWLDEYQDDLGFKQQSTFYVKPGLSKLW